MKRLAHRIEPVIQEGQSLERDLQEKIGSVSHSQIAFTTTATRIVIVEGGAIGDAHRHLTKVQRVVKDRLEELEREIQR